ncbi:MAG: anion permease [Anaerolinea sp.]|nr:anion permease [Anaerolinea sp.]
MPPLLIVLIILALGFSFLNGIHDSANIVATMISSRAIRPQLALTMTAIAVFSGPFIFGVAVANTIGHEIVGAEHINIIVLIAALISAIVWNILTWILGIPSSSSHALIGGILGGVVIASGLQVIKIAGLLKILITLFVSPVIGFFAGMVVANIVYALSWKATPRINGVFKKLQIISALGPALGMGSNDAPKTMGIIALGMLITGVTKTFTIPFWVILISSTVISIGTAVGGWKLIRTLGSKFYKIRPIHGFAAQLSAAIVILTASLLGGPVSTTQVVSTAIMGVGAADRPSKVRWGVAGEIASAWLFTIPSTALLAAGIYWLITVGAPAMIKLF